ncbi:MAG: hypothetical protein O2954_11285 [bacterium]|nr:hypothetical protein [bacterium]
MGKRTLLKRAVGLGMVLALTSLPLLSGCVAMASQDQLRMLEEARKAAEAAEANVNACKQNHMELERTLEQKKQELQIAVNNRDAVRKALGQ